MGVCANCGGTTGVIVWDKDLEKNMHWGACSFPVVR